MKKNKLTLIQNGTIVTMNSTRAVFKGDLLVDGNRILKIAKKITPPREQKVTLVDATDTFVIPGLIQSHTHLVQALMRGEADDMALMQWLESSIWPAEANHNKKSIRASAALALLEMQLAGTTSILDMGTVKNTQALLEEVEASAMRYWGGKCLMDRKETSGPLYESTSDALYETDELISEWMNRAPLIQYALCPRFAVSCTEKILRACADYQEKLKMIVHTHASENLEEIALVKKLTGFDNIEYFDHLGLLNSRTAIVHGVHTTELERKKLIASQTPVIHCPSSNLKLASGIAPMHEYIQRGMVIGIGSDGAPCNNSMDPFIEIRLAALIQKPANGAEAMPAMAAFELATLGGAKVLGMEKELGSLEEGKLADIAIVDRSHPSVCTIENPYSALVYSCLGRDVKHVWIDGKMVVKNFTSTIYDEESVRKTAVREKASLLKRF